MASPQIENGYTKIANSIMDALVKIRVPGEARQVLDAILRKTYGWNKITDQISLSQFVEMTGLKKEHICRSINKLVLMNIITKKGNALSLFTKKDNDTAITYGLQKDFEKWQPLPKKITLPKKIKYVTKKDNPTLPILVTTKDTSTKDTSTKEKKGGKTKNFSPPSFDDVRTYCRERKNCIDPERFINFYESKGWMVGKNKMKEWKAAVRNWELREKKKNRMGIDPDIIIGGSNQ